ncbi:hypothetical protein BLS_006887 [Venturia inaequalis]|uniref:Uncharacterized protein n=1 Tax=Venturia inaequalis TaxID=5025 RepID=A0A8H3UBS3_VENIN|nr:hypothetical protein BLS_006887 [Venturia inaequalis]
MEHDDQTHVCSTHCPPRCFSLEHASRQHEAYRNWRLARTFSAESVASLGPQSLDWQQLRSDLKQGGATEFSLEVWDTLREFIRPPPVRLLVHASQPGRPLPFGPSPDVDRSLDGAKKLLELLDQEPGDVSEGKASFGGPRTATQLNSFEEGKDMTHASHIRRLKERGETKNAHIIASLEAQDALAEEGRIVDCWQKKHRQFWYVILYMSSRTSIGDHTTAVLVQMLDKLYGLCYNHKESCPGHQNRGPVHHFRCAEKPSCQSELENPFKHERYLWFWERLPECWNAYEFFAPVFRTVVQHKGSMRTMHSNCIFSEDFTPFVPTGGPYPIHTSKQDGTKTRKQATQLAGIEWIRLNAFLARFVRLRGEDKPFVHEGGKHYNVLWLKGMYTMIEAFEVTQDRDDRKIKDELRDKFASALKNTSGAPISIDRLWDEIKAEHEAKYQAQLEIDNEVLIAALGAACVWITLGGLTATYLDKNSYILRQELSAQIDNDSFPGYMDIRWGRHPYATGNLNLEGLLKDWHKRYGLWHRRLIQIIDDHSSDSWLFHLARQASNQIMEDWLEQETEYFISQPLAFQLVKQMAGSQEGLNKGYSLNGQILASNQAPIHKPVLLVGSRLSKYKLPRRMESSGIGAQCKVCLVLQPAWEMVITSSNGMIMVFQGFLLALTLLIKSSDSQIPVLLESLLAPVLLVNISTKPTPTLTIVKQMQTIKANGASQTALSHAIIFNSGMARIRIGTLINRGAAVL